MKPKPKLDDAAYQSWIDQQLRASVDIKTEVIEFVKACAIDAAVQDDPDMLATVETVAKHINRSESHVRNLLSALRRAGYLIPIITNHRIPGGACNRWIPKPQ